jgi:glycosyltransferase involved in cell wall biosynthesis
MNVSVVIPLYNKVRHIQRAVESVLSQSFSTFELIVVDDGSTDGSGDVVRHIADSRIRMIVQPNAGESAARNRGVAEAHTNWVAFLDSDDEWMPRFLERVVEAAEARPSLVGVFTNISSFSENRPWLACRFSETRAFENYFAFSLLNDGRGMTSSSSFVRRQNLEAAGGFPVGIHRGGDIDTWSRLALQGEVAYVPEVLAVFHNEVSGSATLFPKPVYPECVTTLRRLRKANRIPRPFIKSSLIFEQRLLLQYAKELTDYGDWSAAMRILHYECQIGHCPKRLFLNVQLRLLVKW